MTFITPLLKILHGIMVSLHTPYRTFLRVG